MNHLMQVQDRINDALADAMKERPKRQSWLRDPFGTCDVPQWVLYERLVVWEAVLLERAARDKGGVTIASAHREVRIYRRSLDLGWALV